ncbi:cysteine-rich CWC family protein [Ramlibacter sp. AN1015]|uniref:cysteine-rich CWC family protein n=1 Tax=Ramlibacter sp. AN1015 TaxID=3133428 RepID=UPI0030C01C85
MPPVEPAPSAPAPISPERCPLCGADNLCAMERERLTGEAQPPCWCTGVTFGAALLERVPEPARLRACICPTCARGADRSTEGSTPNA